MVFKTSTKKLEIARQMLKDNHFMAKEYCFFDWMVNQVKSGSMEGVVYGKPICNALPDTNRGHGTDPRAKVH